MIGNLVSIFEALEAFRGKKTGEIICGGAQRIDTKDVQLMREHIQRNIAQNHKKKYTKTSKTRQII